MATVDEKHANPEVYGYFILLVALAVVPEKLASTPLKSIYKDQLHLGPVGSATIAAIIAIPGYFAFALGLCRDRFNPLKMGDRGFILVFGLGIGLLFVILSRIPLSFNSVAVALLLIFAGQTLIRAAYQALMRNTSEARLMSGRMSTTYQLMVTALPPAATVAGGWLTDHHMSWRTILILVGAGYGALGLFGFWKPAAVYDGLPEKHLVEPAAFWAGIKALANNRAYWVAATIWGLWAFSPGAVTAIYYYMTTTLKMSQAQFSIYDGLTTLTLVPSILLFGLLIKKVSLWRLLLVATVLAIPQMVPLMLIHTAPQAYMAATFMGLTGGLANAAYWSVVIRASPQGLAGAGMLMAISFGHIFVHGSDVLGGYLYNAGGFAACAWVTTAVYMLLLPLIYLIPKNLVSRGDW
jgi:MFS family permease